MFSTLDATWDRSARRGWSTFASFIFQGLALSLLFAVPLFWVQGPPRLRLSDILAPPPPMPAPAPAGQQHERRAEPSGNVNQGPMVQPTVIPATTVILNEPAIQPAPDLRGVPGATGARVPGVPGSIGNDVMAIAPPPSPPLTQSRPLQLSHMDEGSLIYRVQPQYPEIARQAHIQGTVLLRAIISKAGTIENLILETGHPMLAPAAIKAVRHWRYRPYVLNGQPVEVETEITVNFVLGG